MEEEEQEETPLKEPLKIREYSEPGEKETCIVCEEAKKPYIQIEYQNRTEYTCEDCYRKSVGEPLIAKECRECGTELMQGDKFCGKCGAKQVSACPNCGEKTSSGDSFCGKCGKKL